MRRRISFTILVLAAIAAPAFCGPITDLFKKSPKPKPEERVPELLIILKTDLDDHKRSSAAEELRQYDPAMFGDMIAMLIDAARNDRSVGVRVEAVQSLAKFQPVSSEVGQLLEQAERDPSMRVKIQARTSMVQYHLAGYRAGKKTDPPVLQTTEPPIGVGDRRPYPEPPGRPLGGTGEIVVPASGLAPGDRQLIFPAPRSSASDPAPMPSAPMPSRPPTSSGSGSDNVEPPRLDLPK